MDVSHPGHSLARSSLLPGVALSALLAAIGCASPGPPRAPSLGLPEPVRDLAVTRIGNRVELHFTAPSRSTDKLPLPGQTFSGQFCRGLEHQPCVALPSSKTTLAIASPTGHHALTTWTDTLPDDLAQGNPHLLIYRVEFFSPAGRSAGASAPAFTATGTAPTPVTDLHAEGSRLGTVLAWNTSREPGDVLLQRENLAPPATPKKPSLHSNAATPAIVWLGTQTSGSTGNKLNQALDTTALPETPYRYIAQRRTTLQLGDHTVELRSAASAPVTFTLHEVFPPPAPTGLTAVGYFAPAIADAAPAFAVDIIWQPVDETGLLAGLAGYNLYREPLDPNHPPASPRTRINIAPIRLPAFHDTTANPVLRYRYSVTAIDAKGNESPAATVLLEPAATL